MPVDDFLPRVGRPATARLFTRKGRRVDDREALMRVQLIDVRRGPPLVGVLGLLPDVVTHIPHGEPPAKPPERVLFAAQSPVYDLRGQGRR